MRVSRLLSAILTLLVVAAPLAGQSVRVQVGSSSTTAIAPSGTLAIPVTVDLSGIGSSNVASISVQVSWDVTKLTLSSSAAGNFGSVTMNTSTAATGQVILSTFAATGTTTTFTLATLTFQAIGATGSTVVITPSVTAIGNEAGQSIMSMVTNVPLNLCIGISGMYGDVNADGAVNILDAQQVARHAVGLSVLNTTAVQTLGDVNSDNNVNILDAQVIARHSAGLSTTGARVGTSLPGCSGSGGGTGVLTGRVVHAVTNANLSGATVRILSGTSTTATVTTGTDGTFTTGQLATGTYNIEASLSGYITATIYGAEVEASQTVTVLNIPLVPTSTSTGAISGTVRNARNNAVVSGATVELRAGLNATTGTIIATQTTSSTGTFSFTGQAAGTYSLLVRATGFNNAVRTGIVVGATTTANQDVIISPVGSENEVRIVLTWGATPSDLDSHLTGPVVGSSTRFHVYYGNDGSLTASPFAALDVDDTDSYGPETITITTINTGTYRYSIHDYSNRGSTSSSSMATSGAVVTVYRGAAQVARYSVPNSAGTLWTVFEMSGTTITPRNTMSFHSNPDDVANPIEGAEGGLMTTDASLLRNLPPKRR